MTRHLLTTAAAATALALPFVADSYSTSIASRVLALGLLAVAVHLLSARAHLPSLGHGAFFGAGAYTTVLLTKAGLNLGHAHIAAAAAAGALTAGLAAVALARLRGLTYVLASLALGMIAVTGAATATTITGGTDGATAAPPVVWPGTGALVNIGVRYLWLLAITITVCAILAWHARSPFAASMTAIGDTESRMNAIGYPVTRMLRHAHLHSGAVAGIAGALWVHATGYINPTDLGLATSALALAAATIGHRHGPVIVIAATGALVLARDVAASHLPPAGQGPLWLGLLLLATAYLPLARRSNQLEATS